MVLPVGSQAFRKSTVRFIGYGMPVGSQSAGVDHFALGPGAQAAESDDVGGVAQENRVLSRIRGLKGRFSPRGSAPNPEV